MAEANRRFDTEKLRRLSVEAARFFDDTLLQSAKIEPADFAAAILREPGLDELLRVATDDAARRLDAIAADAAAAVRRSQNETLLVVAPAGCALAAAAGFVALLVNGYGFSSHPVPLIGLIAAFALLSTYAYADPARGRTRRAIIRSAAEARQATASQRTAQQAEIDAIIRDKVMQVTGRAILEREIRPSYDLVLPAGSGGPLGEVFQPWFGTQTKAHAQLDRLFASMSGGSIGISGPRGAGKTTLMNYFCRRGAAGWMPHGRPVVAFATPAPAAYEARDFALHLFATLCHAVLQAERSRDPRRAWYIASASDRPGAAASVPPALRSMAGLLAELGLLILLASADALGLRLAATTSTDATIQHYVAVLALIAHVLGVKLGACFLVGGGLFVAGYLMLARCSPDRVVRVLPLLFPFLDLPLRAARRRRERLASDLAKAAVEHLDIIHFQRSFTTGWSGSVTLPVGLAATSSQAEAFAQRQESLPEIIGRFTDFVSEIAETYTVVIGIDELDKMKSDEKAENFLNDNKVLFGLDGCFYIVSISESALASFERRGLPIRDVFDSSFDEVVNVLYLDTAEAVRLLRRRIPDLPLPIACLCHCLAGGLPRDLIRACRALYLLAPDTPHRSLQEMAFVSVRQDFQHKCKAMAAAAKPLASDDTSEFLVTLSGISRMQPDAELFERYAGEFVAAAAKVPSEPTDDDRRLSALYSEFASYLLYCATLLAFFQKQADASMIDAAVKNGLFDALAEARQSMSLDPKLSWKLCAAFRRGIGLQTPSASSDGTCDVIAEKAFPSEVVQRPLPAGSEPSA